MGNVFLHNFFSIFNHGVVPSFYIQDIDFLVAVQQSALNAVRTQDVLMSQQHGVVDLSLSEPGLLISGGEDFDCDTLSLPLTPPYFTVTALTWWART